MKKTSFYLLIPFIHGLVGAWLVFFVIRLVPGSRNTLFHLGVPPSLIALVTAIVFIFWKSASIKSAILRTLSYEPSFTPAQPSDYPGLDVAAWDACSAALGALGFAHVADYTMAKKGPRSAS